MNRLGNIEDLPLKLRQQLKKHPAAKPGPASMVIDALKALDGIANTDELLIQQYRMHKAMPKSRAQFQTLLYKMRNRNLIEHRGGRTGLWALPGQGNNVCGFNESKGCAQ